MTNYVTFVFTHLKCSIAYSSSVCGFSVGSPVVNVCMGAAIVTWFDAKKRSDCSNDCCANRL